MWGRKTETGLVEANLILIWELLSANGTLSHRDLQVITQMSGPLADIPRGRKREGQCCVARHPYDSGTNRIWIFKIIQLKLLENDR